ncbi:MAG: hypothetical protein VX435_04820 [Planctomycetota bacterium]|jgi:hypothetical protein|nr:hypothetical protein [Planctomycetota bacterium]
MIRTGSAFLAVMIAMSSLTQAGDFGFKEGSPELRSAGNVTFGPDGVLFVADSKQAVIFALDTQDSKAAVNNRTLEVTGINQRIAGMVGVPSDELLINDMAVNPISHNVYLSVSRGRGPNATPLLMKVTSDGGITELVLDKIHFSKATLPNPPLPGGTGRRNRRAQAITDMAYVDGQLFVAGLSNEEFSSQFHTIAFPFKNTANGTSVEIYHGAHGRFETRSPVRTFVPFQIKQETHLVAAYTCTPLVKFPVTDLKKGQKVQGTTVAELGNRNRPLDMISYEKNGEPYLLIANSARGVMKVKTTRIGTIEAITDPVTGGGSAGLSYETIAPWKGVLQLDRLNEQSALVLVRHENGTSDLKTLPLP